MKRVLGIITARGGSKGIPRKNIKKLDGKPLIAYTIEVAKKSKLITELIVSTDDKEIANTARKYEADVPFLRPQELAQDKTPHLPVIQHAVKFMEGKLNIIFDYIIILQPTSPLRIVSDIDNTIKKNIDANTDSAVSLVEIEDNHPIKIKKMRNDKVLPYCLKEEEGARRQDLPTAYKRSGAAYVVKRDILMRKNKLYGNSTAGFVVAKERSIDIDNPIDWIKAEYMLKELKNKGKIQ